MSVNMSMPKSIAMAAALISAREDSALPVDCAIFGEISLSGAVRPVCGVVIGARSGDGLYI